MTLAKEKQELKELIEELISVEFISNEKSILSALEELQNDVKNDFFTVVVLGEFKRGKSTLINAMLKTELLPTDVLPETATINALMYSDEPTVQVVMNDGSVQTGKASQEYLKQFSARQKQELAGKVKYIKIGYPSKILENNLVIVDTPGVDDINESRCEVTYRFVPKANAVIFLLDAKSPLKKTEKDFIDSKLLPLGLDTILFVANKYDAVDEEEDENYIEDLRFRLSSAFKVGEADAQLQIIQLYPLSAKWALQGALQRKSKLTEASGINELLDALRNMVFNGKVEQSKIFHFRRRLRNILETLLREYEKSQTLKAADVEALKEAVSHIQLMLEEKADAKKIIAEYVDQERQNIKAMINKSLRYFHRNLEESVVADVELYKGTEFKEHVEKVLSRRMQRSMETWIANNSPNIEHLLSVLEKELSRGLSYHFNQKVNIEAAKNHNLQDMNLFNFHIYADDVSHTNIKAGAIAAGGAGLMMLLMGTNIITPFIGMAALPLLQRHMLENKLLEAKGKVIPAVQEQLAASILELQERLYSYVDTQTKTIEENVESGYELLLVDMQNQINEQIAEKEKARKDLKEEIDIIGRRISVLKSFLENC